MNRRAAVAGGVAGALLISGLLWLGMRQLGPDTSESARGGAAAVSPGSGPSSVLAPVQVVSPAPGQWRPVVGLTWQWQLSGRLDLKVAAQVYDVDAFETTAEQVAALHRDGRKAICYVNAGAYENFRPDKNRYPAEVLGRRMAGWPGERWLDIRRWDVLGPILADRMAMCRNKGFDGVEPDNVDGYANNSGFKLTANDQLTFNRRLASLAHSLGLAVGLKNDVEQADDLVQVMDFAVNEECVQFHECGELRVFTDGGKPVFHVEYELRSSRFCKVTKPLGFSSMRKHFDLDAWRKVCP